MLDFKKVRLLKILEATFLDFEESLLFRELKAKPLFSLWVSQPIILILVFKLLIICNC